MKILTIKIQNLASLPEAEIDFTKAPLKNTGLFAITGETGAGKSTMLDAICLAFYGKTARLKSDSKNKVIFNGDDIKLNDPRHLLRRGTVSGYAEVGFIGQDGAHYIARWQVARARNKLDGRIKEAEHVVLKAPDDQVLAQKSKAKLLLQQLLGLNFEQFTRAVLLAQHDFAAFLKANADERAQLLECLTGTEQFSQVGKAIFEAHKAKLETLERFKHKLGDIVLLSDEEKEDKEALLAQLNTQHQALTVEIKAIEQQLSWYVTHSKLQQQHHALATTIADTESALVQQQEEFKTAKLAQLVQHIADNRQQRKQSQRALLDAESALETLSQVDLQPQIRQKEAAVNAAESAVAEAQASLHKREPDIIRVRELDRIHAEHNTLVEQHQAHLLQLRNVAQNHEKELHILHEQVNGLNVQYAELSTLIATQPSLTELTAHWQEINEVLQQYLVSYDEHRVLAQGIKALESQYTLAQDALAKAQPHCSELEQSLSAGQVKLDQLHAELAGLDYEQLQFQKSQLNKAQQAIAQQTLLDNELLQLQAQIDSLRHQQNSANAQRKDAEHQDELTRQQLMLTQDNLHQVQLRASDNISALRAQLEHGKECIVCGATEHPYHVDHIDTHWQQLISDFESQYQAAEKARAQTQARYHEVVSHLEQVNGQLQALLQQHAQIVQKQNTNQTILSELPESLLDVSKHDMQLSDIDDRLAKYSELTKTQQQTFQAQQQLQQQLSASQAMLNQHQSQLQELSQDLKSKMARSEALDAQCRTLMTRITGAYPEPQWLTDFERDPLNAVEALKSKVAQRHDKVVQLQKVERTLADTQPQLHAAEHLFAQVSQQIKETAGKLAEQQARCEDTQAQRAALLPLPQSADAWLQTLQDTVSNAQSHLQTQKDQCTQLMKQHDEQALQLKHLTEQRQVYQQTLKDNQARFLNWISEQTHELNETMVDELLALQHSYWQPLLEASQVLESQLVEQRSQLQHVQKNIAEHRAVGEPDVGEDELNSQLEALATAQTALHPQVITLSAHLQTHQDNVEKLQAYQGELQNKQSDYENWHLLNRLLGDATGKTMRNLAQTQTLKILLHYANHHLSSLSRRYRLTVIGQSLEIAIIDRDMADEQRSVNTLSGGESFLVSLALALGLASLSSNQVQINSLFIDEGFGTLDPETLSVALDALDALQSQGRKVGVISHVAQMTERVATQIQIKKQAGGYSSVVTSQC
ncbi:AAA family ATPase [Pseudoalteromonas sp. SMS1]|uniref:AAA family ATPase n=1 Tax=Pseudoalteromonas sp. SMS1 TaxID=2908894 RepID=UPI001F38AC38|nr:AAA family ATPase [Pseudoalteromonas sp. SMS1]MCF2857778.1 AAA family ATPase [Pseudoalteromonas sp. SMS1]